MIRSRHGPTLALAVLLGATAVLYWPGLGGIFLFDDFSNLEPLRALKDSGSSHELWQYVLNGVSSALGRPLALLTFAWQRDHWPNDYPAFAQVNIALHLLNGALWYASLTQLRRLGALPGTSAVPLAACALWLLLPIHASTVLYAVQRMVLLATTFMLAGLALYLRGRIVLAAAPRRGYVLMTAGTLGGALLATLSKEIGALLPLLILGVQSTLLRSAPRPHRAWTAACLWLPTALLGLYLARQFPQFLEQYASRDFTLAQRLLTEPRVLWLYLGKALVPSGAAVRLLYDDLVPSTALTAPLTTLLSLAGWAATIAAAWALRNAFPALGLAVWWYLAGHVLEASVIPLELAFDHRSYLPLLGPALAAAMALDHAVGMVRPPWRAGLAVLAAGYLASLAVGLYLSCSLWGRPLDQAWDWARSHPDSRRSLYHFVDQLLARGAPSEAEKALRAAAATWTDDPIPPLTLMSMACRNPAVSIDRADLDLRLRHYAGSDRIRVLGVLQRLVAQHDEGACPEVGPDAVLDAIDASLAAPHFAHLGGSLQYQAALLLQAAGRPPEALQRMAAALAIEPQVPLLQYAVLWSLDQDDPERARQFLDDFQNDPRVSARARWLYRTELQGTRQLIELYESLPTTPAS